MPNELDAAPDESLPDALIVPACVLEQLQADAAKPNADRSALARLQFALRSNEQAVKARLRAHSLLALAQAGYNRVQIAKMLGVKPNTVKVALWRARRVGRLNDLKDALEHDTSALAVDRVNSAIRKGDAKAADVAIEHLKGVGLYKNHSNVKNEGGAGFTMPPLQINVVVKNEIGAPAVTPETFDVSEMSVGVPREDTAP
jgi:hypothetical protein